MAEQTKECSDCVSNLREQEVMESLFGVRESPWTQSGNDKCKWLLPVWEAGIRSLRNKKYPLMRNYLIMANVSKDMKD